MSCTVTMWMSSSRMPVVSAAIWVKTVSAPWPISVAPIWSCAEPSWLRMSRALAVSSEIG